MAEEYINLRGLQEGCVAVAFSMGWVSSPPKLLQRVFFTYGKHFVHSHGRDSGTDVLAVYTFEGTAIFKQYPNQSPDWVHVATATGRYYGINLLRGGLEDFDGIRTATPEETTEYNMRALLIK